MPRVVLALAVLACACSPEVRLGTSCERTSQCTAPLVCSQGRCREECRDHRDCPLMARCLLGSDGLGVCTLPDDSCSDAQPCGEDLVCRDGACFDACLRASCPAGGTCDGEMCQRHDADAAVPLDGGVADAGPPAWRACTSVADCAPGEICANVTPSRSACRQPCTALGGTCTDPDAVCVMIRNTDMLDGYGCTIPCDARSGAGCEDDRCEVVSARDSFSNFVNVLDCRPPGGTMGHDELCTGHEGLLCEMGTTCTSYDSGATDRCVQICTFDGTGQACPAGTECRDFRPGPAARFEDTLFGRCIPPG